MLSFDSKLSWRDPRSSSLNSVAFWSIGYWFRCCDILSNSRLTSSGYTLTINRRFEAYQKSRASSEKGDSSLLRWLLLEMGEATMNNWSNYAPPVGRHRIGLAARVLQLVRSQLHSWKIVSDPLHLACDLWPSNAPVSLCVGGLPLGFNVAGSWSFSWWVSSDAFSVEPRDSLSYLKEILIVGHEDCRQERRVALGSALRIGGAGLLPELRETQWVWEQRSR